MSRASPAVGDHVYHRRGGEVRFEGKISYINSSPFYLQVDHSRAPLSLQFQSYELEWYDGLDASVQFGVISWNAWFPETDNWGFVGPTLFTTYANREPVLDGVPNDDQYWYTANQVTDDGNPATAQQRVDSEINWLADYGLPWTMVVWYETSALVVEIDPLLQSRGSAPPNVTINNPVNPLAPRLRLNILTGGAVGAATFEYSTDDGGSWTGPLVTGAAVALGATGLVAAFTAGTYTGTGAGQNIYRGVTFATDIALTFATYLTSPVKSRQKFALMANRDRARWPGAWQNYDSYTTYWVSQMLDADYLKLPGNRPVFFLFQNSTSAGEDFPLAQLDIIRAKCALAGLGVPYFIAGSSSTAQCLANGTEGRFSYGPRNRPPGTGRMAWQAQGDEDVAAWSSLGGSGLTVCLPLTPCSDGRPRGHSWWTDRPTYDEFETWCYRAYNRAIADNTVKLIQIYAKNELDEGGDFLPTDQLGPYYLGAVRAVTTRTWPQQYANRMASTYLPRFTRVGAWVETQGITGAFQLAEMQSSTAGDYIEYECLPDVNGIGIYGGTGPGLGTVQVSLDGVVQATVDLSALPAGRNQLIWQALSQPITGPRSNYVVRATVVSGLVGIDEIREYAQWA